MSKSDQKIIVVNKNVLFENGNYFEGFRFANEINYESIILENMEIMRRGSTSEPVNHLLGNAEMNYFFKQPIGYAVVANLSRGKVFAYQRSSNDKEYREKRLQGKWSWGFGGHIEPFDIENGNPIRESMLREVTREELEINGKISSLNILGYINDDAQRDEDTKVGRVSIGRVHFGILYLLDTDAKEVKPNKESTIVVAKKLSELEELCLTSGVEAEEWSRIALQPLKKYFNYV